MKSEQIPIVSLEVELPEGTKHYSKSILEDEIKGIDVEHVAIGEAHVIRDSCTQGYKTIYLFLIGSGNIIAANTNYEIGPETIFLPNGVQKTTITPAKENTLHYLKITSKLSHQDDLDLKELPIKNTQDVYCAKFKDCQAYTESIKSSNTISRTILSNKYIPRIAMGSVEAKGPDSVGAHEHPMLEQLFLGLAKNNCVVYADEAKVNFRQYSVLHIPLGSRHSVYVEEDETMYYVWMDFFLDKKGEAWLDTHKVK